VPALPPCVVLTAGLGTRLRPLTWLRAKPALPVAGVPLVNRILAWLASAGARRAVLNLHHLPGTIRAAVAGGAPRGLEIRYSFEDPILGSAGGPKRAIALLDAPRVLVVNGDTLTDVDLGALLRAHDESGALVTMAVVPNREPSRYGGVLAGDDGSVAGFAPRGERSAGSWHFVGVQVVEAAVFERVPENQPSESVGELYPRLVAERPGSVRAFRCDVEFHDIGTPADYLATSIAMAGDDWSRLAGPRSAIGPGAEVSGSILWEDVTVGAGARVRGCIVTDGVSVAPGAVFAGQVLVSERHAAAIPAGSGARRHEGLLTFQLGDQR